ncbi:hypothetical protein [Aureimonas pseudogalii]|uniref:Uncharacterized protein n=1 Tax=Aureimonas pseudogalii TaxID=1744844 RepID=A0A7W6H7R2_9HYPH|nr:hypothetical protein [Aureimonas pseudogalii]MBB4000158.1 hypothetical protein [Aureimonas pseudogalii]
MKASTLRKEDRNETRRSEFFQQSPGYVLRQSATTPSREALLSTISSVNNSALTLLRAMSPSPGTVPISSGPNSPSSTVLTILGAAHKNSASNIIVALLNGITINGSSGRDLVFAGDYTKVNAGDGDDVVVVGDYASVSGGRGRDFVMAGHYANVEGGDGDDVVFALDYATVRGGRGNDYVEVHNYGNITGDEGDDVIQTYDYAKAAGGLGDDQISTYAYASVAGGDGDDSISTYGNSTVSAGAGSDRVRGYGYMTVDGGAGSDDIRVYDYASVDAGDGDDVVVTMGNSTIDGGRGNDTIIVADRSTNGGTAGHGVVDAGEGDDVVQVGSYSTVTGGTGDDRIVLTGTNSTIAFKKGDGRDQVQADFDVDVTIGGYSVSDVIVSHEKGNVVVSFKGSSDRLTLDIASGVNGHLAFADGTSLTVTGNQAAKLHQQYVGAGEVIQVEDYASTAAYQTHQWSGYSERQVGDMKRLSMG